MIGMAGKGAYPSINQSDVESIQIPLPPLEVQKEIVAEIDGYQKVINGARAVLEQWKPAINRMAGPLDVKELVLTS
jgi:type I restriction enzyme M protein